MTTRLFLNTRSPATGGTPNDAPLRFHQRLPDYAPTPLVALPELAATLGLGKLWVKDESHRLGMPSFKILGASWATYRAIERRLGALPPWRTVEELAAHCAPLRPLALAAATDGNHGRAVARLARLLGFGARIFVPAGTADARIAAIAGEGADVVVVNGTYDDAVALSAGEASERCLVISDTSWPGYEDVPRDVIDGYSTIFHEADAQLAALSEGAPDLVTVQIGVGALAAAVVRHYRNAQPRPAILGVEPTRAACALASIEVGQLVEVPGPHDSIMAGLNCGLPSAIAWPDVSGGVDAFVAINDQRACAAVRSLARAGVVAGETGAAGLGGLSEVLAGPRAVEVSAHLGLRPGARVLLISTEGATDPVARARILAADCARDCAAHQACKPQ